MHTKQPTLSKPLKKGEKIHLRRGHLEHDRIIGSRVWDLIQAYKGRRPPSRARLDHGLMDRHRPRYAIESSNT